MLIASTAKNLHEALASTSTVPIASRTIICVPTMGALHEGHAALVRRARSWANNNDPAALVVVTIFVNPTQFNDPADLQRYPRTLDADCTLCEAAGADAVLCPSVEEVYPPNAPPKPSDSELPAVATAPKLEDARRPGHFAGVYQVVRRLFELTRCRRAVFGEKDWQQLQLVRAMVQQLNLSIHIDPAPTIRESDGLAMSSRNRFLSPTERAVAPAVYRAMQAAQRTNSIADAERTMRETLQHAGLDVEYAVAREAQSLMPITTSTSTDRASVRLLIAAKLGSIRLIDNAPWG
ncbi:MAG: pantoate--beta-alanine ligase [Phycisphaerales bacterium]|nr:pantoate--beta-alanine ligase [Phycisphaerales bacterium]